MRITDRFSLLNREEAREKVREAAVSMLPIVLIVAVMSLTLLPMQAGLMLSFLLGALLTVVGIGLFSMGSEMSMIPIGSKIGTAMTRSRPPL